MTDSAPAKTMVVRFHSGQSLRAVIDTEAPLFYNLRDTAGNPLVVSKDRVREIVPLDEVEPCPASFSGATTDPGHWWEGEACGFCGKPRMTTPNPTPTPLSPEREAERLRIERDELAAAAKRVGQALQSFMDDTTDPGTEALAAQYELSRLLAKLSIDDTVISDSDYLSRFSVTPAEVHRFLASRLAEDVHLRYQQAVGGRAVEEAAKDLRMTAAALEAEGEKTTPRGLRDAANEIDPLKHGGPFPSALIRFGSEGGDR
ncbi:hypothetical protein ABZ547_08565 [Streptomyces sparsogenes]|uniref:hypothetical protein n=1 Tax=Streptomyces sparsogenes TaxID=67365 RepID=UPI0033E27574